MFIEICWFLFMHTVLVNKFAENLRKLFRKSAHGFPIYLGPCLAGHLYQSPEGMVCLTEQKPLQIYVPGN